jgi:hypothetical protein
MPQQPPTCAKQPQLNKSRRAKVGLPTARCSVTSDARAPERLQLSEGRKGRCVACALEAFRPCWTLRALLGKMRRRRPVIRAVEVKKVAMNVTGSGSCGRGF